MTTLLLGVLGLVAIMIVCSKAGGDSGSLLEWRLLSGPLLLVAIFCERATVFVWELCRYGFIAITTPLTNRLLDLWSTWINREDRLCGKVAGTLFLPLPYAAHGDARAALGDLLQLLDGQDDEEGQPTALKCRDKAPKFWLEFWLSFTYALVRVCLEKLASRAKKSVGRTGRRM